MVGVYVNDDVGPATTVMVKAVSSVVLQVKLSVADKRMVYVPGLTYKCVGSVSVDVVPSPKSQRNCWPPKDVLVNTALYGAQPVAGVTNCATKTEATLNCSTTESGELQNVVSSRYNLTL